LRPRKVNILDCLKSVDLDSIAARTATWDSDTLALLYDTCFQCLALKHDSDPKR